MLIRVLRQTMLSGRVVKAGDVLEASPSDARLLIGIGKAVEVAAAPVKIEEPVEAPKPKSAPKRRRSTNDHPQPRIED